MNNAKLNKWLGVQPDEWPVVQRLLLFSFFMGFALSIFYTASASLFLQTYSTQDLPWAFIAGGLLALLAWRLSSLADRKLLLQRQLEAKLWLVAVSVLVFCFVLYTSKPPWLLFVIFTWVRVLVYLAYTAFWGLAGYVFNVRQGKRLFGLIGSGEVLSNIIGFGSIPLLLQLLNPTDLFIICAICFFVCLLLMQSTLRTAMKHKKLEQKVQDALQEDVAEADAAPKQGKGSKPKPLPVAALIKQPFFSALAVMSLLPLFSFIFVDYLFLNQVKRFSYNPNETATILALVLAGVALAELLFKTTLSGRLMQRLGLKYTLIALPAVLALLMGAGWLLNWLLPDSLVLASFIVIGRLADKVGQGGIYHPSVQLMYQPLDKDVRFSIQNLMEGVPKALGNAVAGFLLLLLGKVLNIDVAGMVLFYAVVAVLWVYMGQRAYKQYKLLLVDFMAKNKQGTEKKVLPFDAVELLQKRIDAPEANVNFQLACLRLLQQLWPAQAYAKVLHYLAHGPVELKKALWQCSDLLPNDPEKVGWLEEIAHSETSTDVGPMARQILKNHLKSLDELKLKKVPRSSRRQAVGMYDTPSGHRFHTWQPVNKKGQLTLDDSHTVTESPAAYLEEVSRRHDSVRLRMKIATLLTRVKGTESTELLLSWLTYPNLLVRWTVAKALQRANKVVTPAQQPQLYKEIDAVLEHMAWLMQTMSLFVEKGHQSMLTQSLEQHYFEYQLYLFRLLGALYGHKAVRAVYKPLSEKELSGNRMLALELLDNLLEERLKAKVMPFFEHDEPEAIWRHLRHLYAFPEDDLTQRLGGIIMEDPNTTGLWLKTLALQDLATVCKPKNYPKEVYAAMFHQSLFVAQAAAALLWNADPEYCQEYLERLPAQRKLALGSMLMNQQQNNFQVQAIQALKKIEAFKHIHAEYLLSVASFLKIKAYKAEQKIHFKKRFEVRKVYFVVKGAVKGFLHNRQYFLMTEGQMIMDGIQPGRSLAYLVTQEDSVLLEAPIDLFVSYLADAPFVLDQFTKALRPIMLRTPELERYQRQMQQAAEGD